MTENKTAMFPKGGKAGIKYRTILLNVVNEVCSKYEVDEWDIVLLHISRDLADLKGSPWDGVS
jgi:hypothetical protein